MSMEGRVSRLEREVGDTIPEDDHADWREREARRLLPLNRAIARIAQYEDMLLPSDDELVGRGLAALARWTSEKAYRHGLGDNP